MESVQVFEVGPRDGLQNEPHLIHTRHKIELIRGLVSAGLSQLEVGAFVRADRIPQMADTEAVLKQTSRLGRGRVSFWSLVPNQKGLERAIEAGAKNIAVFTAVTDSFALKNIGMTVAESLRSFRDVIQRAHQEKIQVRAYVSTAFGCPYEGKVAPARTIRLIERLLDWEVAQVSVGDTIGVATPRGVESVFKPIGTHAGWKRLAGHFHDTRGTALANALRALDLGVRTLDSSVAGLGGCPYAPGASGNLATEDLVYMLHGMGFKTGIDLRRLCRVSHQFSKKIHRPIRSRYLQAQIAGRSKF